LDITFISNDYYSAVGASGAVTGILFSALLLYPDIELMLFLIPIPSQDIFLELVIYYIHYMA